MSITEILGAAGGDAFWKAGKLESGSVTWRHW